MRIECTLNSYSDQFTFSLSLPLILVWLCLCVWKEHLQPKRSRFASCGKFPAKRHCILFPYASWFTVMERSNWPWKYTRPYPHPILSLHFCWKLQRLSCYGKSCVMDNQKHPWRPKSFKCVHAHITSSAAVCMLSHWCVHICCIDIPVVSLWVAGIIFKQNSWSQI